MKKKYGIPLVALALSATVAYAQAPKKSDNYTLLKNATIIDMVGDKGKKGDVLINNDKIEQVSYSATIQSPEGAVTYDLTGKYLIPGLIDNHVHITHGTYDDAVKALNVALKNGITGVRDMGGDGRMLAQLQRNALIGENASPDVFFSAIIAGPMFFEKDPRPSQVALGADVGNVPWQWAVDDNTDFENIMIQTKGLGATAIKIYTSVDKKSLKKAAKAAKKQGLKVWSHAAVAPTRPSDIINAGADVVSHVGDFVQYELADKVIDRYTMKDQKAARDMRKRIDAIEFDANTPKVKKLFNNMKKNNTILDATLWVYQKRSPKVLKKAQHATKIAYDSGVKIGAGSDNMNHESGYTSNIHAEIKLLKEAGLSNIDALKAATIVNAEGLGEKANVGSIEKNKLANLVVLDADPLENIDNTRTVNTVFKRGKAYDGYSSLQMMKMMRPKPRKGKAPKNK